MKLSDTGGLRVFDSSALSLCGFTRADIAPHPAAAPRAVPTASLAAEPANERGNSVLREHDHSDDRPKRDESQKVNQANRVACEPLVNFAQCGREHGAAVPLCGPSWIA